MMPRSLPSQKALWLGELWGFLKSVLHVPFARAIYSGPPDFTAIDMMICSVEEMLSVIVV
jgi:hypothetical protein